MKLSSCYIILLLLMFFHSAKSTSWVTKKMETRELKQLIAKKLIKASGQKGAGAFYTLN